MYWLLQYKNNAALKTNLCTYPWYQFEVTRERLRAPYSKDSKDSCAFGALCPTNPA